MGLMKIKKFRWIASKFGMRAAIHAVRYNLQNKISFYMELSGIAVTMDSLEPSLLKTSKKYDCRFLEPVEILKFAKDPRYQISQKFLDIALGKEDLCYGILDGEHLVSYGWYSLKPTALTDDLFVHFGGSWSYMYKGYTPPEYRGQKHHAAGMARSLEELTKRGLDGLISVVETNNFPSLRSCKRMGYYDIDRISIIKPFGRYLISSASDPADRKIWVTTSPSGNSSPV